MNANELADELKEWVNEFEDFAWLTKHETMLRKQQAEIETLQTRIVDRENEYSQIAIQNETNKALLDDANAEIEALKEHKQHYDQWLKNGVYFTKEEYKIHIAKQQSEIEAFKKALKEIIAISDRNHNAWNKAKELLK